MSENTREEAAAVELDASRAFPRLAYSVPEVARLLSVERTTLYRHAKLGRIMIRKLGARSVILSVDLAEYLRALPVLGASKLNSASK
jgi:hypothetical protein